jgi:M6 family metalloprotease-like protein
MTRGNVGVALSIALAAVLLRPTTAHGVIVWEGKVVPAWPAQAGPRAPVGASFAAANLGLYPHPRGTVYGLTLLIDFADASPAFTKSQVDAWLNEQGYSEGGLNGSVRDYFADQSNGMVDFQNEIFGFYRAKQSKSYYEGKPGYSGSDELFAELMDYFDGMVDFSKYDNDGDGRTDAVSIVYAGEAETWGQGLWPHASGSTQKRDGVTVARYMMTNLGTSLGLYTFSHEVGHMLFGWPDLYGFGNYCIMGNGSSQKNPVGINDLYRADQGWIPVVDVTPETNALFSAKPNGAGYRYTNPADPEESFFWSNVQSSGRFSTIAGDGLLLLHFDKDIGRNDPPNPLSLAVVQADGKKDLDQTMWPEPGSDADDFFHGDAVSEFSDSAFMTARWNDGSASGLRIYDIAPISENMTFKVGNGPIVEPVAGAAGMTGDGGAGGAAGASPGGASGIAGATPSGGSSSGGGGSATPVAGAAGTPAAAGSAAATAAAPPAAGGADASCACRLGAPAARGGSLSLLVGLSALGLRRRRRR